MLTNFMLNATKTKHYNFCSHFTAFIYTRTKSLNFAFIAFVVIVDGGFVVALAILYYTHHFTSTTLAILYLYTDLNIANDMYSH